MKHGINVKKPAAMRVLSFLLIVVMLVTTDGMQVFASYGNDGSLACAEGAEENNLMQTASLENDGLTLEGSDSVGNLLLGNLNEKKEEAAVNGCIVYSAEVSGNKVSFELQSIYKGILIAAVYDEAGEKQLMSGRTKINAGDRSAEIVMPGEFPEYFYLRAYIVDDDLSPLSEVYNCPLYTSGMQAFLSKTVTDFDAENVLNLDEEIDNNFLVYKDGTIRIKEAESRLVLKSADEEGAVYVFEDPDSELAGLAEDSVLSYEMSDGRVLIIAVAGISKSGNDVTIAGGDVGEADVFTYIKIDTVGYAGRDNIDGSALEDGITLTEVSEAAGEYAENDICEDAAYAPVEHSWEDALEFNLFDKKLTDKDNDNIDVTINGSLKLGFSVEIKYYLDAAPWNWEGEYIEVKLEWALGFNVSLSGTVKAALPLADIIIPVIPGVCAELTPSFVVEVSAEISLSGKVKQTLGFRADMTSGLTNLSGPPETEIELSGELKVFIGLSLEPEIIFVSKKVADVSMTARVGAEISGSISTAGDTDDEAEKKHACVKCVDGDIYVKAEIALEVSIGGERWKKSCEFDPLKIKIDDWYYSFDNDEFGLGSCRQEAYKVIYYVTDSRLNPIKDAIISGNGLTVYNNGRKTVKDVRTDEDGMAVVYQELGDYSVKAWAEGYELTEAEYWVSGTGKQVIIKLPTKKEKYPHADEGGNGNGDGSGSGDGNGGGNGGGEESRVGGDPNGKLRNPHDGIYSTVYFGHYWQNNTNNDGIADENDSKEPIRWRVLSLSENDIFLLADSIIAFGPYNDVSATVTWENSSSRRYLNDVFIYDAFDEEEIADIKYSYLKNPRARDCENALVGNDTIDRIFSISEEDATNPAYGFDEDCRATDVARRANPTAFSKAKGLWTSYYGYPEGEWWTRTGGIRNNLAINVTNVGQMHDFGDYIDRTYTGLRPALHLKRSSTNFYVAGDIYADSGRNVSESAGQCEEEAGAAVSEEAGLLNADGRAYAAEVTKLGEDAQSAEFSGLENEEIYNLYVMWNEFADDSLSDNNLLYIAQGRSGADGKLSFEYKPTKVSENAAVFAVAMRHPETYAIDAEDDPTKTDNPEDKDDTDPKQDALIALKGLACDKNAMELFEGESAAVSVIYTPADASNKKVTWSSSDINIATVADGTVTAVKEGRAVIKAVSDDGGHEAICELTVKKKEGPLGPEKPDLSKYTASGNEISAKSLNLKKTLFKGVKSIKKFRVSAGDADAVKIKGSTLTILKNGSVTIEADNKKGEKLAEKTVTVIAPAIEKAEPTQINRRGNLDLNKYISSTVKPAKWKSSNKKIAEVSGDGLLTIKKSGTVKITVTFPKEKGMTARTLTIKLKIAMPQFKKSSYTVKTGKTVSTAVKNADGADITYRMENEAVATVDAGGNVTGVSKGTTKLIMTVKGIDYETKIKVK